MTVIVMGHTAKPTAGQEYDTPTGPNQQGALITTPQAGSIFRLGAWLGGDVASFSYRLVLWDSLTSAVLGYTAAMTTLTNNSLWRTEGDLLVPVDVPSGHDYLVGWAHGLAGASNWYYPINASGSGTHYDSGSGYQSSWPTTFGARNALNNQIAAYAQMNPTVGVKVRRSGAWVDAPVKVRRGGAWIDAPIKVRRGGAWVDVS